MADGGSRGFDPALRVEATMGQIRWLVLDRLMSAGLAFQRDAELYSKRKAGKDGAKAGGFKAKVRKTLRERQPW